MSQLVFADFPSRAAAEMAVTKLDELGYGPEDVSVITKDNKAEMASDGTGAKIAEGATSGATTGGVIGGIAGLLAGAGVFPALAGLLIGGPITAALGLTGVAAATVSGVVTGAVAGGLIGALTSLGLSDDDAKYYNTAIENGGVLLVVQTDMEDQAAVEEVLAGAESEGSLVEAGDVVSARRVRIVSHTDAA